MATLILPDTAVIGDPGHIEDHNLIVQAIVDLNAEVEAGGAGAPPDSAEAILAAQIFS